MLPTIHTESVEQSSQRQANFIVLRSLESQLPSHLFSQVLSEVSQKIEFPQRIDWKGDPKALTFGELKTNFSHIDQNYLPQLLQQSTNGVTTQQNKKVLLKNTSNPALSLKKRLAMGSTQNMSLLVKQKPFSHLTQSQKLNIHASNISRFERVKTVCGHAALDNGDMTAIYNVIFDRTGRFIISGADDGIIKIWDVDTLTLQASLHGHLDVITDIDISKCNRYLASASKDGQVFIWDFQKCLVLDKLPTHSNSVNNIKFFQFSQKQDSKSSNKPIQLFVTCSEDGSVRVYDEKGFLFNSPTGSGGSQEEGHPVRRTGRLEQTQPKKNRYYVTLTPDEYRPGSRNKKIESVTMNEQGILVAGTNNGDILLWKLDYAAFQKQQGKASTYFGKEISLLTHLFIGCFKKHSKDVHFTEFSPNGNLLLTGSTDGTAKVWNLEEDKVKKSGGGESASAQKPLGFTDDRVRVVFEEKRRNPQCDCLTWSVHGRYAIVSISGKTEGEQSKEISIIKVWDSYSDTMIHDLAKHNGISLSTFSFVVAAHPKYEEILLTGSEGGQIILWNLQTLKVIKKFIEYGIYSLDKYTFNDPYDGKFSPDGSCFVVGSNNGTLSLFSNEGVAHKYAGTRVEQFLVEDGGMHGDNIYEKYDQCPQICSSSLMPYEVQPPSKQIGPFKNKNKLSPQEYERQYQERVLKSKEEEEFIQTQLEEGLRNNFFNNNLQEDVHHYIDQLINDEDSGHEEAPVARNGARQRIVSDAHPVNNRNRGRNLEREMMEAAVQRMNVNQNYDPDNSFYDRESDGDFVMEEDHDEDDQTVYSGIDQESEYVSRNRRENYHQQQRNNREARQKDLTEVYLQHQEDQKKKNQLDRTQRALRRQIQKGEYGDSDEEEDSDSDSEDQVIKTRNQRRKVIGDADSEHDGEFKGGRNRRRLVKNSHKVPQDMKSSDEESFSDESAEEEGSFDKAKNNKKAAAAIHTRNKGRAKVNYANMDESQSEMFDDEEEEKKHEGGVIQINTASTKSKKTVDEDYELIEVSDKPIPVEEALVEAYNQTKTCALCFRSDFPLIGPFYKFNAKRAVIDGPLHFHKDCIEINLYSTFDKSKGKWVNIGKALECLARKKKNKCVRCNAPGATIQCSQCHKFYHGFLCSQTYQIWLGGDSYQCYECRNKFNYKVFHDKPALADDSYHEVCKKIPRDYLLADKASLQNYFPQMNDLVYYFFQGHEKFIHTYNCFFYCGDQEYLTFEYPWHKYPELTKPTLCRITQISYGFPSPKAINLIKKFGKSSNDISQTPQIITDLELEIVGQANKVFSIAMFPHELPEFLVLKNVYDTKCRRFQELLSTNQIIGQVFTTTCRNFIKVRVTQIQPKESLFPHSQWETILFQHQEAYGFRNRQGRRGQRRNEDELNDQPPGIMNFWELNMNDQSDEAALNEMQAFDAIERERIENVITDFNQKQEERIIPFLDRVTESVAVDYKCHVPTESFLTLVLQRLRNNYYRSQEVSSFIPNPTYSQQLFFDLDMISYNAKIYNGEDEFLSKEAKRLMEKLRCEIKKHINSAGDKNQLKKEDLLIKLPGKLTAPPVFSVRHNPQQSSHDLFMKQMEDVNVQQNNICKKRAQVEESKRIKKNGHKHNDDEYSEDEEEEDSDQDQDMASFITPKLNGDHQPKRRLLRTQHSENGSIQFSSNGFLNGGGATSEEKTVSQEEKLGGLGKRKTRASRQQQRVVEHSESEQEDEEDFTELKNTPAPVVGRYPKRFKNA